MRLIKHKSGYAAVGEDGAIRPLTYLGTRVLDGYTRFGEYVIHTAEHTFDQEQFETKPFPFETVPALFFTVSR